MLIMLAIAVCLIGMFALLVITELLGEYKILKGEYRRKFLHITGGSFIAFWPWLISWRSIEILGLAMVIFTIANRYFAFLNYHGKIGRASFGDIFLASAVFLTAVLTHNKIFFALALLEVALADGLAAVAGISYGKHWGYKVFKHKKTVIGSMVFWITTVCIFGAGLLPAHDIISFQNYFIILLLIPPALTLAENVSILGLDNLVIPLLTILILHFAALTGPY